MFYKFKSLSNTILPWVVGFYLDCHNIIPLDVDVLIFGCVFILSSIPKAKFDTIKGLSMSSRVWT